MATSRIEYVFSHDEHGKLCRDAVHAIVSKDMKNLERLADLISSPTTPISYTLHSVEAMLHTAIETDNAQISKWLVNRFKMEKYGIKSTDYICYNMLAGRIDITKWYLQTFNFNGGDIREPLAKLLAGKHYSLANTLATFVGCDRRNIVYYMLHYKFDRRPLHKQVECALFTDYYMSINPHVEGLDISNAYKMLMLGCKLNHLKLVQLLVERYYGEMTHKEVRTIRYFTLPQARISGGTQAIEWLMSHHQQKSAPRASIQNERESASQES